jgi:hypothetical protein
MGNSAWGHGYHRGFEDGAKQGGTIVGLVLLGAAGLAAGGRWGYMKLRDLRFAKVDAATAEHDLENTSEGEDEESEGDGGRPPLTDPSS